MRFRRLAAAAFVLVTATATRAAVAQPAAHWNARVELGAEYDTNPTRTETVDGTLAPPITPAPLGRVVISGGALVPIGSRQEIALSGSGAGKQFVGAEAEPESLGVAQGNASWRVFLGERTSLGTFATYYEAFQRRDAIDPRDFRSWAPGLRFATAWGLSQTLGLAASHRFFTFKPESDAHEHDFRGPSASIDYRLVLLTGDEEAEWDFGLAAGTEWRTFEGVRQIPLCPPPDFDACGTTPSPGSEEREDTFHTASAEVTRVGGFLVGVGYGVQWNRSNSWGESVFRHVVHARGAASLPLGIYLTGRVELVASHYRDPVTLIDSEDNTPRSSIEDETRNSLRIEATRDIGRRLQGILRYTFYTNQLGTDAVRFRRQTILLGLAASWDK